MSTNNNYERLYTGVLFSGTALFAAYTCTVGMLRVTGYHPNISPTLLHMLLIGAMPIIGIVISSILMNELCRERLPSIFARFGFYCAIIAFLVWELIGPPPFLPIPPDTPFPVLSGLVSTVGIGWGVGLILGLLTQVLKLQKYARRLPPFPIMLVHIVIAFLSAVEASAVAWWFPTIMFPTMMVVGSIMYRPSLTEGGEGHGATVILFNITLTLFVLSQILMFQVYMDTGFGWLIGALVGLFMSGFMGSAENYGRRPFR